MKTKTPNVSGRSAWLRDNITKYFSFSAIIILLVALSLTQDNFLGTSNLKNLLRDTAPLMIMSAGMTMVLLFGSIDLSMGAVCSVSNVTYIHLMLAFQDSFSNPLLTSLAAMAVSLAFGLASGLALGIIHVKLKVPSFIASLGFMSLWQSVALLITQNPESVPKALWGTVVQDRLRCGGPAPDCGNRHYPVHPLCYPLHPQRTDHFCHRRQRAHCPGGRYGRG